MKNDTRVFASLLLKPPNYGSYLSVFLVSVSSVTDSLIISRIASILVVGTNFHSFDASEPWFFTVVL